MEPKTTIRIILSLFRLYKRLEWRSNVSPVGEGIAFSVECVFAQAASQAAPFSYRAFSFRCSSEALFCYR
jgi:hypothetical protein